MRDFLRHLLALARRALWLIREFCWSWYAMPQDEDWDGAMRGGDKTAGTRNEQGQ